MGILAEYNPDLCLRSFESVVSGDRNEEECLPRLLDCGKTYKFLKRGQRHYWFKGEIPLRMTEGDERLSRPIGSVRILEATHFLKDEEVWTKGKYEVVEVYDSSDDKVHFDGLEKI